MGNIREQKTGRPKDTVTKTIEICRLCEMLEGRLFLLSDLRCLQLRNGMETDGILLLIVFTTIRGTVGVIEDCKFKSIKKIHL